MEIHLKELVPNLGISQKEINNLVQFISSMNLDNKKDIILDLGKSSLSKSKIIEFVQNNNFIFKQDDKNILTHKKARMDNSWMNKKSAEC